MSRFGRDIRDEDDDEMLEKAEEEYWKKEDAKMRTLIHPRAYDADTIHHLYRLGNSLVNEFQRFRNIKEALIESDVNISLNAWRQMSTHREKDRIWYAENRTDLMYDIRDRVFPYVPMTDEELENI